LTPISIPFPQSQEPLNPEFLLFFGFVSLLLVPLIATLDWLGEAQHSVAHDPQMANHEQPPHRADSSKKWLPMKASAIAAGSIGC
jgi:hypothetical protein